MDDGLCVIPVQARMVERGGVWVIDTAHSEYAHLSATAIASLLYRAWSKQKAAFSVRAPKAAEVQTGFEPPFCASRITQMEEKSKCKL